MRAFLYKTRDETAFFRGDFDIIRGRIKGGALSMELKDYQKEIIKFDVNGPLADIEQVNFAFLDKVLGLAGESGEVADKIKKIIRDQDGIIKDEDKNALGKELGDVLWHVATCARYLGLDLEQVAQANLNKLESRQLRGKIAGSGDER